MKGYQVFKYSGYHISHMTTPKQFLEAFFQKKASIYSDANTRLERAYAEYFGEPLLGQADSFLLRDNQVVDEVMQATESATVITRAHFKTADLLTRYLLSAVGESWRIVKIERQCFICHGTGRFGATPCKRCGGEGWLNPRENSG